MGMVSEFKEFASKGNVMDLAVGVIIGAAFGKIVDAFVNDLLMPIISSIFGSLDFSNLFVILGNNPEGFSLLADLKKAGIPVFAYGSFISVVINFLLLAFAVFIMVRQVNRMRKEEEEAPKPAEPAEDIVLLREIRDSLKK